MMNVIAHFFPRCSSHNNHVCWYLVDDSFGDRIRISKDASGFIVEQLHLHLSQTAKWEPKAYGFETLNDAAVFALDLAKQPNRSNNNQQNMSGGPGSDCGCTNFGVSERLAEVSYCTSGGGAGGANGEVESCFVWLVKSSICCCQEFGLGSGYLS